MTFLAVLSATYGATWFCWIGPWVWTVPVGFGLMLLSWVIAVTFLKSGNDRAAGVGAFAMVFLGSLWGVEMWLAGDARDDRALHDRGVTETAEVVELIRTSDPMAGIEDKVTAVVVRLPSGARPRMQLEGRPAPERGAAVTVTRDPERQAPMRFGPRPEAPDTTWRTTLLALSLLLALPPSTAAAQATHTHLT
ncbi:hypothetical protein [Streptomyces sp. NPDC097619]|uniref:hypothetical protein n=1 Tax=Streptomyces sp. NPDC097619 TaxID=3157228 RepID=UPI0033172CB6